MHYIRRSIALGILLLVAACQHISDKYPFDPQFVSPDAVLLTVLKAPPQPGSKKYRQDLAVVLEAQRHITHDRINILVTQDIPYPEFIAIPVLGEDFTETNYPITYNLLRRAGSDSWRIGDVAKEHWNTKRPWRADPRVKAHVKPLTSGSYPSGHSTSGHTWAHILADIAPERRDAFYQEAWSFASNRMAAGMHFPSDIRAGKQLSEAIYHRMSQSLDFQRELRAARCEVARKKSTIRIRDRYRYCEAA